MAVKVDSLGREIVWLHEPSSRPRDSFPPARLSAADSETAPSHQLYRPGKRQRDGAETFRWGSVCCPRASRGALPLHRYQRFPYATTASFLGRLSMGRLEDRFDAYSVGWRGLLSIPRQAPRLAHRLRRSPDDLGQDCRKRQPMSFSNFNLTTAFQQLQHQ